MSSLVVNCRQVGFGSTLGVAHALIQLCAALAADHDMTFVVADHEEFKSSPFASSVGDIAERIVSIEAVDRGEELLPADGIELLPHHFQEPEFCGRSIGICYDLHVFDIPWKYGDGAESMQAKLRRSLTRADAVMTVFPRTFYAVEHIAGITLMNLFLTESPLLLDTRPTSSAPRHDDADDGPRRLLYPAQLQEHKNHSALVEGCAALLARGHDVAVDCPGSEFRPSVTAELAELVASAALEDRVSFLGRVSDQELINLYASCDGVVVPSLAEGGAYVALEAIAAGKPVAVNRIDAARMHLEAMDGHVIWFDARDPHDTANAMEQLVTDDPAHWLALNAACRERISAASWVSVAAKWNTVIYMLDGGPRPVLTVDRFAREVVYG